MSLSYWYNIITTHLIPNWIYFIIYIDNSIYARNWINNTLCLNLLKHITSSFFFQGNMFQFNFLKDDDKLLCFVIPQMKRLTNWIQLYRKMLDTVWRKEGGTLRRIFMLFAPSNINNSQHSFSNNKKKWVNKWKFRRDVCHTERSYALWENLERCRKT